MIFEFDKDFAKEAVELGLGRVITRNGDGVTIINWNYGNSDVYSIAGVISKFHSYPELWSEFGEYSIGCSSSFDLFIEVFDNKNESNSF